MGKTEEDWNGLKLGFLKTVQPNSFSKFISAVCNFKNDAQERYLVVLKLYLILSFTCNFFAYFKFHSDWGQVIGEIKQNELDCHDRAPLILKNNYSFLWKMQFCEIWHFIFLGSNKKFSWVLLQITSYILSPWKM